jgi:hypothetical protein
MKAIWITPQDIGASFEFSDTWINFCIKLGYDKKSIPHAVLISSIFIQ